MQYSTLTPEQQAAACSDIWNQLTKEAGSQMITIAWSRMSVEEAIKTQTSGELEHFPHGWRLSDRDYNRIYNLVEYPPGPEEYQAQREEDLENQGW